ncbi:hypothetical protein K8I85_14275 [bacterium]|nr:hypothetical protein [bacterium]
MAKRFMYMSIGVLCLVAAYQIGVERARAEWSVGTGGQVIGGGVSATAESIWYGTSGEAWTMSSSGWVRQAAFDLPVASSEVEFLDSGDGHSKVVHLITTADVGWICVDGEGWQEIGPFPGGPVALDQESWGKVKAKHR